MIATIIVTVKIMNLNFYLSAIDSRATKKTPMLSQAKNPTPK